MARSLSHARSFLKRQLNLEVPLPPSKARRRSWLEGAGGGDRPGPVGASLSGGSMSNSSHKTPIQCNSHACSLNSVCCGLDPGDAKYYCASHCSCFNGTGLEMGACLCDPGFHGIDCAQQISPTVWLAVILSVGTMLVLFLAWGFRCQDADFTDLEHDDHTRTRRAPLLREGADRVVAAARPPTTRETESPSSADVSCTGAGTSVEPSLQRRTCCVCLSKPLQVVLIPCGHACLCRRCSRKLDKCPLCRLDIQATQVGGVDMRHACRNGRLGPRASARDVRTISRAPVSALGCDSGSTSDVVPRRSSPCATL